MPMKVELELQMEQELKLEPVTVTHLSISVAGRQRARRIEAGTHRPTASGSQCQDQLQDYQREQFELGLGGWGRERRDGRRSCIFCDDDDNVFAKLSWISLPLSLPRSLPHLG